MATTILICACLAVLAIIFFGKLYSADAMNSAACRQAVIEAMETDEVQQFPGEDFKFLARTKDGSVWYVETMGGTAKPTCKTLMFPSKEE